MKISKAGSYIIADHHRAPCGAIQNKNKTVLSMAKYQMKMYHKYIANTYVKVEKGINETLLLRLVYLPPGHLLVDSWCLRGLGFGRLSRKVVRGGRVDGLRGGSREG